MSIQSASEIFLLHGRWYTTPQTYASATKKTPSARKERCKEGQWLNGGITNNVNSRSEMKHPAGFQMNE